MEIRIKNKAVKGCSLDSFFYFLPCLRLINSSIKSNPSNMSAMSFFDKVSPSMVILSYVFIFIFMCEKISFMSWAVFADVSGVSVETIFPSAKPSALMLRAEQILIILFTLALCIPRVMMLARVEFDMLIFRAKSIMVPYLSTIRLFSFSSVDNSNRFSSNSDFILIFS